MVDILIRGVPAEDVERLDEQARRMGLSRADYLRRQLQQHARRSPEPATVADLATMATTLRDLDDPDVMDAAWS